MSKNISHTVLEERYLLNIHAYTCKCRYMREDNRFV